MPTFHLVLAHPVSTQSSNVPWSELNTLDTERQPGPKLLIYGVNNAERRSCRKGKTGRIVERQGGACRAQKPADYRVHWPDVHRVLGCTRPGESKSSHVAVKRVLNGGYDRPSLRLHFRRSWPTSAVETAIAGWAGTFAVLVCRYLFNAASCQCIPACSRRICPPVRKTFEHVR